MGADKDLAKRYLNPPAVKSVRYQQNFIKTAVCELRFPALLELETKPPRTFQKAIRKDYPFYEPQIFETPGGASTELMRENRYLFRSKDKNWTVSVKSFSLALETSKYVDFEDFFNRLRALLKSAQDMIDSDFFTRVGLRYINAIPLEDGTPEGWVRPDLLAPIAGGALGLPKSFASVLTGDMANGHYSIRHGMKEPTETSQEPISYTLDFDYYADNLEASEVPACIQSFHDTNFSLFNWCLGEKAKKLLGPGKAK